MQTALLLKYLEHGFFILNGFRICMMDKKCKKKIAKVTDLNHRKSKSEMLILAIFL